MADFSHLNHSAQGQMVDITTKAPSHRKARVEGCVKVSQDCMEKLTGDMIREISSTARIAGTQAAKATSQLIPYCHPLALTKVTIEIEVVEWSFRLSATAKTVGTTGVEMEALVACQIAAATIYDMIKAVDPSAVLGPFQLVEKSGGKSGEWAP